MHGPARPQLLPVDNVAVAFLPSRGSLEAGQIGASLRLGEPLYPDLTVKDRGQVAMLLVASSGGKEAARGSC